MKVVFLNILSYMKPPKSVDFLDGGARKSAHLLVILKRVRIGEEYAPLLPGRCLYRSPQVMPLIYQDINRFLPYQDG